MAQRTGLKLEDRFYEGEEMAEHPLTVAGILWPTYSADDRAIFFSLASAWEMNEVSREMTVKPLTAVLVRPKRLSDIPSLHRKFKVLPDTQAVLPSSVLLTIFNLLSLAEEVLQMIPAIIAYRTAVAEKLSPSHEVRGVFEAGLTRDAVHGISLFRMCQARVKEAVGANIVKVEEAMAPTTGE